MTTGDVFGALADPTRRQIVDWLIDEGSGTATAFAARLPITRQAVTRHLAELECAGLVHAQRVGRETRYRIDVRPLSNAAEWLETRARRWDGALERLKRHVETLDP